MRLRPIGLALAIPIAAVSHAQFMGGALSNGIRAMVGKNLLRPNDQNPMQPSGFQNPPPVRSGDLPLPGPYGPDGGVFNLINHGGDWSIEGDLVHMTGGVEFTDRGYHVWADEVIGNRSTSTYTLKGNVRVQGEEQSIYGDLVRANFVDRTFLAEEAESTLKPTLVQGRIKGNVYVKAQRSWGSELEAWGEKTSLTTCSYPDPHFEILAEQTDVRPGRRVIFRKLKVIVLGRTLLVLPYLSVPLDERTYNNLPVFGQGRLEGYFVKTRYSFDLNQRDVFTSRFDYYTRLGLGLGGSVRYENQVASGRVSAYTIQGQHSQFELSAQHRQKLGWADFALDTSYQDSNYLFSSNSRTFNTRATLLIPRGFATDRVTFFQTSTNSPGVSTLQRTVSVNDTSRWTKKFSTNLDVNYSTNTSSFTGTDPIRREQVDLKFRAVNEWDRLQARLDYIRSIPIGETTNFFSNSDVTPALTLLSDSRKLLGNTAGANFPFQTQLSWGEYTDPLRNGRISRGNFDFTFNNPRPASQKRFDLNYQGEFEQGIYSDDTAQYVLRAATQASYKFARNSALNLRYNYVRPYGFTPLQIDRRGNVHSLIGDFTYMPIRNLQLGVGTGYDFNLLKQHATTPWQQVALRAEYRLSNYFRATATSLYDTGRHSYSNTRLDVTWIPGDTYVSFGTKYDGIRNTWAAANLYIDGIRWGRLRMSTLLNYNGYTKRFDAQHYSFIYDLHCAEAVLQVLDNPTGFNSGRQIFFFLRLKALPFDTPFGTGQRGQPIGTGTGAGF